jgi:drug/metabolite transporter (DMT)-like permease
MASPGVPDRELLRGRLCIIVAALMWSTSSAFAKVLTQPTGLAVHEPPIEGLQIAFFRALFAGLVLLPFLRRGEVSFHRAMLPMTACFAVMNASFVSALALGTAANAIVLQYTAPVWMYLGCTWLLGEPADRRTLVGVVIAFVGVIVIVAGEWDGDQLPAVQLGILSSFAYAVVMICLRVLSSASATWLTAINHLVSAVVLVPFVAPLPWPSGPQLGVLFLYGAVQMTIPYWLVARGVRSIPPHEAGMISLIEPLLNPLWAYLAAGEEPTRWSVIGGVFIVGALLWRYFPVRGR